jgi:hypothetical protein
MLTSITRELFTVLDIFIQLLKDVFVLVNYQMLDVYHAQYHVERIILAQLEYFIILVSAS